jgi:DNA transposition AAA+ family ATPase
MVTQQTLSAPGIAQIANLDITAVALQRLVERGPGLPGLGVLHGPAGWGKTLSCNRLAQVHRGYFVSIKSAWSRKTLLEKILKEMGIKPHGTIPNMLDQVCDQLAGAGDRPLILDEFDHAIRNESMLELVRDMHDGGQAAILMVGEEQLPTKLQKWERFHSRVLAWVPAQPISLGDAKQLAPIYAPGLQIADDLLVRLVTSSQGSVRRVVVNLRSIAEEAAVGGWDAVDAALWGDRPIYTGETQKRRV